MSLLVIWFQLSTQVNILIRTSLLQKLNLWFSRLLVGSEATEGPVQCCGGIARLTSMKWFEGGGNLGPAA